VSVNIDYPDHFGQPCPPQCWICENSRKAEEQFAEEKLDAEEAALAAAVVEAAIVWHDASPDYDAEDVLCEAVLALKRFREGRAK
jgi:hypothetical protein